MDMGFITEMYMPMVMVACLIAGYILKKWCPCDNKIIPTVLTVFGAVIACASANNITIDVIVGGALSGLASTGLHQAFKQFIDRGEK